MKREEFENHFPHEIGNDFKTFVREQVLDFSRYLFVQGNRAVKRGYCTYCQNDYMLPYKKWKHNELWICEKCNSPVCIKQAGRGRGKMLDTGYAIWYEKSKVDSNAIIATGYLVSIDYREDFKGVTKYEPVTRYLFQIGKATMMHKNFAYFGWYGSKLLKFKDGWSFTKKIYSLVGKHHYTSNTLQSIESIERAIDGTSFAYSTWEKFVKNNVDAVGFWYKYSKYPFIEYLSKMGMEKMVECMLFERPMYRTINYRGKNMEKILGLSKKEIKEWKISGVSMEPVILHTYKWFRKRNISISWETAKSCNYMVVGTDYLNKLTELQKRLPLEKIMQYLIKQFNKRKQSSFNSLTLVLGDWYDYLEECEELGMDIKKEHILCPNNLQQAHSKTSQSIKVKLDERLNLKIEKQQKELEKFSYSYKNLFIRPARSCQELFDEGKALIHCVGRYTKDYANGQTVIMFIRKRNEPNTSYYTVEIDREENRLVQCRGWDNESPDEDVTDFLNKYIEEVLNSHKGMVAV